MNKSEVCVKLTRKNCKKVYSILKMFAEPVCFGTMNSLEKGDYENGGFPFLHFNGEKWDGNKVKDCGHGKTLIKPSELRNILAKEHLKKGDLVKIKTLFGQKKIVEVTDIDRERFSFTSIDGNLLGAYDINDLEFLRYATDKEKALLEPVPKSEFGIKEFIPGEWYVDKAGSLVNYQGNGEGFGWVGDISWTISASISVKWWWRKATEHEVIEALTKECVKRYGKDWENVKIKAHASDDVHRNTSINKMYWHIVKTTYCVWNKNGNIFYKGQWAEPLKEPETYTREVWVNHYSDQEFHIPYNKEAADFTQGPGKITVKATLTYDIPMTKV